MNSLIYDIWLTPEDDSWTNVYNLVVKKGHWDIIVRASWAGTARSPTTQNPFNIFKFIYEDVFKHK